MLKPINVIFNADDLGYHHLRDDAIIEAKLNGVITSASLMVNGKSAASAPGKAARVGLQMVLHLNITEGKPISPPEQIPSLIHQASNYFLGKEGFWEAAKLGTIDAHDIVTEVEAQLKRYKELVGSYPTHVDGHQHAHIAPGMPNILAPIFRKYQVQSTRVPIEVLTSLKTKDFYKTVVMQASIALPVYTSHGIQTSQFFTGLRLMGAEMTYCNVVRMVRETCLRQQSVGDDDSLSTIEIMCHPGVSFDDPGERKIGGCGSGMEEDLYDNGVDAFCISTDRDTEFNTLTDPRLKHFLKRENLILCSWQNAFSRKGMHLHKKMFCTRHIVNILANMSPMTGNEVTALRWRKILSKWYDVRILDTRQKTTRSTLLDVYRTLDKSSINSQPSVVLALNATRSIPYIDEYKHPYVVIAGGTDINNNFERCINVLNNANCIVTFTDVMRNKIVSASAIRNKNVVSIPQSVDTHGFIRGSHDDYSPWFRKLYDKKYLCHEKTKRDVLILLPAGIRTVKDPAYLVDVINQQGANLSLRDGSKKLNLPSNFRRTMRLILVGPIRDQELYQRLKAKESECFRIHPPVPRAKILMAMKEADVVVNTSLSEGMSSAILEAMSLNTLVMARDIPANRVLLKNLDHGILFSTPEEFCKKMCDLFVGGNEKHVERLIKNAKKFVNGYSMDQEGLSYLDVLSDIFEDEIQPFLKKTKVQK